MQPSFPLPPEILLLILQQLDLIWLCRARLVCKAFADAGLRCLVSTVTVARCPASFERVQFIRNHPVLKFYVKKLVYAYDDITLNIPLVKRVTAEQLAIINQTVEDIDEFEKNGGDIGGLKELIQSFPGLQQINLESPFITHGPYLAPAYLRLNSRSQKINYDVSEASVTNLIGAIGTIDAIRSLRIDDAAGAVIHIDPPRCFQELRCLHISFKEDFKALQMDGSSKKSIPRFFEHSFPALTHLHISVDLELHDEGHLPLSFPLPATLQTLELDYVQLPYSLRLPPHLKRLALSHCKLMSAGLGGWINVLASCTMECEFGGYFTAEESGPVVDSGTWCDCRDELLGTELGSCLAEICSPYCPDDVSIGLLKVIFDPFLVRTVRDVPVTIDVPEDLAEKYHQFRNPTKR